MLKPEVRIIAWDDCAFKPKSRYVRIVGVIYRGGSFIDGLLSARIEKDGTDATDKMAESMMRSRHYDQLSYIMLDGISYAGFNLVDIKKLYKKTGLPVIAVQRKMPDMKKFSEVLRIFSDYSKRLLAVRDAGRMLNGGAIFFQKHGLSSDECRQILKLTCIRSNVPEPLRVAHIIASGLSRREGESRGRA